MKSFQLGATYDKCVPAGVSGTTHLWKATNPAPADTCNCECYSWEEMQVEMERRAPGSSFWPTEQQGRIMRQHNDRLTVLHEKHERERAAYAAACKEHWKTHCPACGGPRHGMRYHHLYNQDVCGDCVQRIKKEMANPLSFHHFRYSP